MAGPFRFARIVPSLMIYANTRFERKSMLRPLLLPSLLITGICLHGTAFAGETVLKPISPWNVEWRDETCTLSRAVGTNEDPVILRMERFAPGDGFQLVVVGKALETARDGRALTIAYGNGKPEDLSEKYVRNVQ